MKAILTGATGMIGGEVLSLCLADERFSEVITLGRRAPRHTHARLRNVITSDMGDFREHADVLRSVDIAFYCLGVYTGQVPDAEFRRLTVEYPVAFAKALHAASPDAALCLLSGQGADTKEKSRVPFARYKGMVENQIAEVGLGRFHSLRPGYIYPVTPRDEPNFMYRLMRIVYPPVGRVFPSIGVTSTDLAAAMVRVGLEGRPSERFIENRDLRVWAMHRPV